MAARRRLVALLFFLLAAAGPRADELPTLRVEPGSLTVSGLSSGGYMAHQFHVAHAAAVAGVAVLAAGPYHCAGDRYPWSLGWILYGCMDAGGGWPFLGPPDAAASVQAIRAAAAAGDVDGPGGLAGDRVFLFSGGADTTVPTPVVTALRDTYLAFVDAGDVHFEVAPATGHLFPTRDRGNACEVTAPPFLGACGRDLAGELLAHLYGPLQPPVATRVEGLVRFAQAPFAAAQAGLHANGHLYVPRACAAGSVCRLHVAFHGCRQHQDAAGDAFFTGAGYNGWAEANRILVLYPQVRPQGRRWPNPHGCWDWWGYTGPGYDRRAAPQIAAVAAMITRLGGHLLPYSD